MMDEWNFGTPPDGESIRAYKFGSSDGLTAVVLNYGATLQAVYLPDGRNVVLGSDTLEALLSDQACLGRIIGRNGNRVVDARFEIHEESFTLPATDGDNNLHSGPNGFDTKFWKTSLEEEILVLQHTSADGDQGFPGEVKVTLKISIEGMVLRLDMEATTTRPTPVNMTWHPYWNLIGKGRIDGHDLHVEAEHRTILNARESLPVVNTRYDFQVPLALGSIQIDDNYVEVSRATLSAQNTTLQVTSSLPDLQIYTGDGLPTPRSGIALEPQFRPNDINLDQNCLLQPGQIYSHWIEYKLDVT